MVDWIIGKPTPREVWEKFWKEYQKKLNELEREKVKRWIEWLSEIERKPSTRAYKEFHNTIKERLKFYKKKLKEIGEL